MAKPGRNDPCPCGSGNKYKKCCLAKEEAVAREQLAKAEARRAERAAETLQRSRSKAHLHADTLDAMLFAAWRLDTLGMKIQFTSEIGRFYWDAYQNQDDKTRVQRDLDEIVDINGRLESLRDAITETRKMYAEGWARENHIYWLDNVLVRYDNLALEVQAKIVAVQAAQRQFWTTKTLPPPEQLGFFLK